MTTYHERMQNLILSATYIYCIERKRTRSGTSVMSFYVIEDDMLMCIDAVIHSACPNFARPAKGGGLTVREIGTRPDQVILHAYGQAVGHDVKAKSYQLQ